MANPTIFENQTAIMNWLRSKGHAVIENEKEIRGCTMKKRFDIEPSCTFDMRAYPCDYCGGWHRATKR